MARDEASWARRMQNWTIGREVMVYSATVSGQQEFNADATVLQHHGYGVQSSRYVFEDSTVMVAFVRHDRLGQYEPLGEPGASGWPLNLSTASVAPITSTVSTGADGGGMAKGVGTVLGVVIIAAIAWFMFSSPKGQPSGEAPARHTACETAFKDASDGTAAGINEYDLDPAMRACSSLAEWTSAWRAFPPPGAGSDPRFVAENRCMTGRFSATSICEELGVTP